VPVLTQALAQRLERAANRFGRAWMHGIEGVRLLELPDRPHLLVPCRPDRPDLDFQNRVNGLTPADTDQLPAIAEFYSGHGVRPWFETVPADDFAALGEGLAAIGAVHIGFHGMLYGVPSPDAGPANAPGITIETIDEGDNAGFDRFCALRVAGYELREEIRDEAARDLRGWRDAPSPTFYVGRVDGEPAAVATLAVVDGVGYLADAATLPAGRALGLQSALVRRRCADAARAGCDVVCSQATFVGTSHRNLQRNGLVAGFTKVVHRVAPAVGRGSVGAVAR
jgi:ribosomal protein S18 acetylase RimI-like enzyme